ncbi:uncharacterized protein LOC143026051 [Oratosquilla oratoria]|uniref:uncharacterized protein LOC143026051 n=1 Tax=Oratosquilla oratoria TaxID=337810 RepID=UPI003F75FD74
MFELPPRMTRAAGNQRSSSSIWGIVDSVAAGDLYHSREFVLQSSLRSHPTRREWGADPLRRPFGSSRWLRVLTGEERVLSVVDYFKRGIPRGENGPPSSISDKVPLGSHVPGNFRSPLDLLALRIEEPQGATMGRFTTSLSLVLVLMGLANAQTPQPTTPDFVANAVLTGKVTGIITFTSFPDKPTHIQGTLCGLTPGFHGFHIHDKGDLSGGCKTAGGHYNPGNKFHGGPDNQERHVGDLGNIFADEHGCAIVDISDRLVSFQPPFSVLGRALVIHEGEDDLGLGGNEGSLKTGNAGGRAGCAVIGIA